MGCRHGSISETGIVESKRFEKVIKGACVAAKIPVFTPGRLRHQSPRLRSTPADMAAVEGRMDAHACHYHDSGSTVLTTG